MLPYIGTPAWGNVLPSAKPATTSAPLESFIAQAAPLPNTPLPSDQDLTPRDTESFPEIEPIPTEPQPEELLPNIDPPLIPTAPLPDDAERLCVRDFQVLDSTVFSDEELSKAITATLTENPTVPAVGASIDCPTGRQLTFAQIVLARNAVTSLYIENDYVTSGAIIPADTSFINGIVTLQAIEGRLENIQVNGNRRLRAGYISSRLGIAAKAPLNREKLLQGLQLLQLNPLIETIRADLQAGTIPGTNLLVVEVVEADSFDVTLDLNNNRSPSVGSLRRGLSIQEDNLLGLGDAVSLGYVNTNGSDEFNGSYTLPISPHNTTLTASAIIAHNEVIEDPFEVFDISSDSSNYSLSFKHPLVQTPKHQFDLGLSLSRQFSQTELGFGDIGPFPLVTGADSEGRTITSVLSFSQDWTQRNTKHVISLRSQFNLGLGSFLDGTTNNDPDLPDNSFISWQGQAQWIRRLENNALFLLRGGVQLASDDLFSAEQFGIGGQATVRGYRQEELLTDNGFQASAEARFPILRIAKLDGTLQVAPFMDFGHGWNINGLNPDPNTLLSIGTGLLWQQPNLDARLDWGIPLISASDSDDNSLQESGIYFSVRYSFF
ncbi:surface antigen [Leptolyngbya sp. Heron Island J]|uniref:ShlB/FhaC/HecB family hemolysin secretion/activation protein n=1 Tax=Leptolyngbya sp. Heron Island J TaxID=1385935 RepID=UPI0003B941F1|nr:ShlB/FhaC/HecB family hemolysin secretion/activation protein [Leptolyngbya sp. Heron Island J]ESA35785.1 surface antigen [Leptolyngbya sp. Heron Island J]